MVKCLAPPFLKVDLAPPFLKVDLAQPFLKVDLAPPFLKVERLVHSLTIFFIERISRYE